MTKVWKTASENRRCSVLGCWKTSQDNVRLHKFPFNDNTLLPVWIMATNRSRWTPMLRSRICDQHFSNDDYFGGNKNNPLKPGACPIMSTPDGAVKSEETDSDVSIKSEINFETPYYTGTNSSDIDSDVSESDCNWIKTDRQTDDDHHSSSSENECEDAESSSDLDTTQLSSIVVTALDQASNQQCAVLLCDENARKQFNNIFFVCFPTDNLPLSNVWWKLCGRSDEFDPLAKICSIHFQLTDFKTVTQRQNEVKIRQTFLKTFNTVPTTFLLPHEFELLSNRKRKKSIDVEIKTEINKCPVEDCDKTILTNSKNTLFFRFPLENKTLLKKWLDNIGLSYWQPSETDKICSDHFEDHDIMMVDNNFYKLKTYAYPSINPKEPFVMNSGDINELSNLTVSPQFNKLQFHEIGHDYLLVDNRCNNNKKIKADPSSNGHTLITSNTYNKSEQSNDIFAVRFNPAAKYFNKDGEEIRRLPITIRKYLNNPSEVHKERYSMSINTQPTTSKFGEKVTIAKTKETKVHNTEPINNGNYQDSGYLQCSNGDDVGQFLSSENNFTPNSSREKILEPTEISPNKRIPKSILFNEELTESYGEMLLPVCELGCQNYCFHAVPGPQRRYIFKEFQMLKSLPEQNCAIAKLIQLRAVKKEDNTPLKSCVSFYLVVNDRSVKVCRLFFSNTLGISESRLNAILNPITYNWYSNRETALKVSEPSTVKIVNEHMTDFLKESIKPLNKQYNLHEPESDTEVRLNNVPVEEYRKVLLYMKSVPRVLSKYSTDKYSQELKFESGICLDQVYKTYSEGYIKSNVPPPYTKRQFKKIYNHFMKPYMTIT